MSHQFGDDLTVGDEVDERDIRHFDKMTAEEGDEVWERCLVAYHLWNAEEGRLKGGCTARHQCRRRVSK